MIQSTISKPKYFERKEGTYASLCFQCLSAYNQGSHHFLWCDVWTMFKDSEDFEKFSDKWNKCLKFIVDTSPVPDSEEIFFPDYEGSISSIYGEYLSAKEVYDFFELIDSIQAEQPELTVELINSLNKHFGGIQDVDFYLEKLIYYGEYDSNEDFAESYFEDFGYLDNIRSEVLTCIDYGKAWRELSFRNCFGLEGGHYFEELY